MIDRIADLWGDRTPYGQGAAWPIRVDQFLEEGVAADDVDAWVQSAAILHSNGDGLDIAVKDGRIVGVRGRAGDRINHGRVDPKDLFGWQANASPDRLKRPLIRRDGRLEEASWDEAMGLVVTRSQQLLKDKGPLSLGFYTSGQLFLEEYYTLGVIGKAGLGTPHMDGNTRLCTATAAAALKGYLEAKARISGVRPGVVFVPFHYGYFDTTAGKEPGERPGAANELTLFDWDAVSKQPYFKFAAVRLSKIADGDGTPAPAPMNTASAPVGAAEEG